jgi:hypothetical protein
MGSDGVCVGDPVGFEVVFDKVDFVGWILLVGVEVGWFE